MLLLLALALSQLAGATTPTWVAVDTQNDMSWEVCSPGMNGGGMIEQKDRTFTDLGQTTGTLTCADIGTTNVKMILAGGSASICAFKSIEEYTRPVKIKIFMKNRCFSTVSATDTTGSANAMVFDKFGIKIRNANTDKIYISTDGSTYTDSGFTAVGNLWHTMDSADPDDGWQTVTFELLETETKIYYRSTLLTTVAGDSGVTSGKIHLKGSNRDNLNKVQVYKASKPTCTGFTGGANSLTVEQCNAFQWAKVGTTENCPMYVDGTSGTCTAYCTGEGSTCAKAADNRNNKTCQREVTGDTTTTCDSNFSNKICVCAPKVTAPAPGPAASVWTNCNSLASCGTSATNYGFTLAATFSNADGRNNQGTEWDETAWTSGNTFGDCSTLQEADCQGAAWQTDTSRILIVEKTPSGSFGVRTFDLTGTNSMHDRITTENRKNIYAGSTLLQDSGVTDTAIAHSTDAGYLLINTDLNGGSSGTTCTVPASGGIVDDATCLFGDDGCRLVSLWGRDPRRIKWQECSSGINCHVDRGKTRYSCSGDVVSNNQGTWRYTDTGPSDSSRTVWLFVGTGAPAPVVCAANQYKDAANTCHDHTANACTAGQQYVAGTATVDSSCTACATGHFSTALATSCTAHIANACVAGQKYVAGTTSAQSQCTTCADGTFSAALATSCTAHSQATAAACAAGKLFTSGTTTADSTCTDCVSGFCASATGGCTTCTAHSAHACAPGTVTVAGTPTADASCADCPANTYSTTNNAASCTAQISHTTCTNRQKYVAGTSSTAASCATDTDLAASEESGANLIKTDIGTCKDRGFQDSVESPSLDTATTALTGQNLVIGVDVDAHATMVKIEMLDPTGTATVASSAFTAQAGLTACQKKYLSGNIAWDTFKPALKLYNEANAATDITLQYRAMIVVTTAAPYDPTVTRAAYAAMANPAFSANGPRRREVKSTFELVFNVPATVSVTAALTLNSLPSFTLQESVQLGDVRTTLDRNTLIASTTFELLTKVNWPWRFAAVPTVATSAQSTANQGSSSQAIAADAGRSSCAATGGTVCAQAWLLTVAYTAGYCGANVGETITVTFAPENQLGTWTGTAPASTQAAIVVTDDLIQCSVQAGTVEITGLLETFNNAAFSTASLSFDIGSTAYFQITIPNLNSPSLTVSSLTLKEVSTQQAGAAAPTFHYQNGAKVPTTSTIVDTSVDTVVDATAQFGLELASSIFDLAGFLGGNTVALTVNAVATIAYNAVGAVGRRRRLINIPAQLGKGHCSSTIYIGEPKAAVVCKDFNKKKQCNKSKRLKKKKRPTDGPCKWKKGKCFAQTGPIKVQCKTLKAKTPTECTKHTGCMAMHIGKKFKGCRGTFIQG